MSDISPLVSLPTSALDGLMPMNAIVSRTGHIRHAGPTLEKLSPHGGFKGARFLEVFELRRPRMVSMISELVALGETKLNLRLRSRPDLQMRGLALPMPDDNGVFVNLSFGIAGPEAINAFNLSNRDFSSTDLTVEMLYLIEAKEAVMDESRDLNMRLQGAKSAAEEQAYSDTLTGLKNRRAMDLILTRYRSCGERFSLMHLDLDHFKAVNDTHGHAAGDFVLKQAAQIFLEETRGEDSVIRFGGDEFVLLFHRLTNVGPLKKISARILQRLEQPMQFEGVTCKISGSIGITMSDDYTEINPDQMLLDADVALYASKKAGRAQYRFVRDVGGVGQSASVLAEAEPLARAG